MREKYESLSAVVLRDLAKARGIKGISTMKKGELVERMLEEDAKQKKKNHCLHTVMRRRSVFFNREAM